MGAGSNLFPTTRREYYYSCWFYTGQEIRDFRVVTTIIYAITCSRIFFCKFTSFSQAVQSELSPDCVILWLETCANHLPRLPSQIQLIAVRWRKLSVELIRPMPRVCEASGSGKKSGYWNSIPLPLLSCQLWMLVKVDIVKLLHVSAKINTLGFCGNSQVTGTIFHDAVNRCNIWVYVKIKSSQIFLLNKIHYT